MNQRNIAVWASENHPLKFLSSSALIIVSLSYVYTYYDSQRILISQRCLNESGNFISYYLIVDDHGIENGC